MLAEQNSPDVDEIVNAMSDEEARMYRDNPQALREMIEQNMKIPNA